MPKRTDIQSILIIGAGPIIIGQACEFDYSGAQACKALKEEGYRIILVNSNPATIMTDPQLADATYIEPLTTEFVTKIIAQERPDALLPTMGGQTALNIAIALEADGVLRQYGVEMIGARADAIARAENREQFRTAMRAIGLAMPRSAIASNLAQAQKARQTIGLPSIIRPSFTLGGTGGGIARNVQEFNTIVEAGLAASPTHEVLIEESIIGWKEYEMEVIRDADDNCIIICSIENIDPMGVHTGDSITVAPALTLTDKEYQIMRNGAIAVLRKIGVETGGSNVQFAVNPKDGRLVVIEMNPRVSRSSALASKATGFPIAKIAALLAVGYRLYELQNDINPVMPASFEPMLDYVVTKIPRFAFEKFPATRPLLGTAMQSVGEVMAIGRNFQESLQKALCSLDTGLTGLNPLSDAPKTHPGLRKALHAATPERLRLIADAARAGLADTDIAKASGYDLWFVRQLGDIVAQEQALLQHGAPKDADGWRALKANGFSDARLGELLGMAETAIRARRHELGVRPSYYRIDSCAGEFAATTPYMYASYDAPNPFSPEDEVQAEDTKKVVILGGGPNRIGQGIEFDYCCCHAAYALRRLDTQSIMINCNPETVSTDYDTADRLYFEPLSDEHVLEVIAAEQRTGALCGVIVQFGGQTPLARVPALVAADIPILGTDHDAIDLAEDRKRFQSLLKKLGLQQPPNGTAQNLADAKTIAQRIGYPIVIRPSYVLGGRAMEIVHTPKELDFYMTTALQSTQAAPVLIDKYLNDAIEVDVDVLSDGTHSYIAGILEHIEEAGIHSGDSACVLPPHGLGTSVQNVIRKQSGALAKALGISGLMNVQFAVQGKAVYVLEVNPRASRTVPFIAKVLGQALPALATHIMMGKPLQSLRLPPPQYDGYAVKEAVLPFTRFADTDTLLGPEMRSTGEVMGWDSSFALAYAKSQQASNVALPDGGCAFLSVRDADKTRLVPLARQLQELGFTLLATHGTARALAHAGLTVTAINKVREGSPHIVDALKNGQVQLVFNTTQGAQSILDSKSIRRTALMGQIPYFTTIAAALATTQAIGALRTKAMRIRKLQA